MLDSKIEPSSLKFTKKKKKKWVGDAARITKATIGIIG